MRFLLSGAPESLSIFLTTRVHQCIGENFVNHRSVPLHRIVAQAVCIAALALGMGDPVSAQPLVDKAVVPEPLAVVPAFSQWLSSRAIQAAPAPVAQVVTVPMTWSQQVGAPAPATSARYEPLPVILGAPELPLVGADSQGTARDWSRDFNYQGVHAQLLVLDRSGSSHMARPMSALPRPGERFKIRITPTFTAVTEVGLIRGQRWAAVRAGQVYPSPGVSVQVNAGESVNLPMEPERYFMLGNNGTESLLMSVRHPQASVASRTTQPAYRQDSRTGSSFLQLTPNGMLPAIEQLIVALPR